MFDTWQASVFALQAVRLLKATPFELRDIKCMCEDGVAVHLSTLYQFACRAIADAAEACGSPTCFFRVSLISNGY